VGLNEVPARVEKQLQEARQLRKSLQAKNRILASLLAKDLYAQAQHANGSRIVNQFFEDEEMEFLNLLAHAIQLQGPSIALLGSGGVQAALLFAESDSLSSDLRQILPGCCELIEGKGGGTRTMVQAGGKIVARVREALDLAEKQLKAQNLAS